MSKSLYLLMHVSSLSLLIVGFLNLCDIILKPAAGRGTGGRGAVPPVRR